MARIPFFGTAGSDDPKGKRALSACGFGSALAQRARSAW
jgi:hypothetical protein